MKRTLVIFSILINSFIIAQNVVINEILYDPDGSDGGYEWIELYNTSGESISLSNWSIQKAGSEFEHIVTFPDSFQINAQSYFLVGEEYVPNIDFSCELSFQNGGSATDGIRLVSPDSLFTDTILYDSPNSNGLPDDISNPGEYFAPNVNSDNTLARIEDGIDTNNCEIDFFECIEPTPGSSNFYPVDLAIFYIDILLNGEEYWIETMVHNLSTEIVDNSEATLDISINGTFLETYELPELPAGDSTCVSYNIGDLSEIYSTFRIEVNYSSDNNLENNIAANSILIDKSPIILNELMFNPESGNQEWVELFNRAECGYCVDNFNITDASGGNITIYGSLNSGEYLVVCQDKNLLINTYPDLNPEKVIESLNWTALNNSGDSLILSDSLGTKFDSTYYFGNSCTTDYSLERVNPYDDENILWEECIDENGGTPTMPNSVLPSSKDLELLFIDLIQEDYELEHVLQIKNIGLENIESCLLECSTILNGQFPSELIYTETLTVTDSILSTFYSDVPAVGYTTFQYELQAPEDSNISNNLDFSFYNNSALPFVVNEIMYDPINGPEWLEIKINDYISNLEDIVLVVDEDTLQITNSGEEYLIVTGSPEDADSLLSIYDLYEIPIYTGLSSLSNLGENIIISDEFDNMIESFSYLPEWNDDIDGISIERVNSRLASENANWGPSVSTATPGRENSIYIQVLPNNSTLQIAPNPFSPYVAERAIIGCKLPEKVSTITLRIFDLKGRMIRKLVNQKLAAAESEMIWDGRDDNGKILPIGIYILLMQATSRETEKTYNRKATIIIAK